LADVAKPYWPSLVTRVATTFFDSSTAWANSADLPIAAAVPVALGQKVEPVIRSPSASTNDP
jgi:hypothetical protein